MLVWIIPPHVSGWVPPCVVRALFEKRVVFPQSSKVQIKIGAMIGLAGGVDPSETGVRGQLARISSIDKHNIRSFACQVMGNACAYHPRTTYSYPSHLNDAMPFVSAALAC